MQNHAFAWGHACMHVSLMSTIHSYVPFFAASLSVEKLLDLSRKDIFKWFEIGLQLGLDATDLILVRYNHPYDNVACLRVMLTLWLMSTTEGTKNVQEKPVHHPETNLDELPSDSLLCGKHQVSYSVSAHIDVIIFLCVTIKHLETACMLSTIKTNVNMILLKFRMGCVII